MTIERFLMVYCFPIQLTIGVIGNVFNLAVLLSKGMRSKTNTLLAVMAFADILFLIFMLPHTLMYHNKLMKQDMFAKFILYGTHHITGIVNMCSFASAWCIVLVSIERVTAVMFPLKARSFWTSRLLVVLVVLIWICAILISMHSHITHTVGPVTVNYTFKNETTGEQYVETRKNWRPIVRPSMEQYWRVAILMDTLMLVFIPVILVVIANVLMAISLRQHKNQNTIQAKSQRRATIIVFVIASMFTLCQTPSAIVHICEIIRPQIGTMPEFRTVATLSNSLVVTGKTANFFLFCTWSSHFRKHLKRIIADKTPWLYRIGQAIAPNLDRKSSGQMPATRQCSLNLSITYKNGSSTRRSHSDRIQFRTNTIGAEHVQPFEVDLSDDIENDSKLHEELRLLPNSAKE